MSTVSFGKSGNGLHIVTDSKPPVHISVQQTGGSLSIKDCSGSPVQVSGEFTVGHGVIGVVCCDGVYCVLIATERELVGSLVTNEWYCVKKVACIPLLENPMPNEGILDRLVELLQNGSVYYSGRKNSRDTHQRMQEASSDPTGNSRDAGKDFAWNAAAAKPFVDLGFESIVLPCIQGFVGAIRVPVPSSPLFTDVWLISRRHVKRVGPRYQRRGVDEKGNAANCVETEQVVVGGRSQDVTSFVTTRGSVPLVWRQAPNLNLTPKSVVYPDAVLQKEILGLHIKDQSSKYGETAFVNLLKVKGHEGQLTESWEQVLEKVTHAQACEAPSNDGVPEGMRYKEGRLNGSHVGYIGMDIHGLGKNGLRTPQVLSQLNKTLKTLTERWHVFHHSESASVRQKGALRVNCLDSLDRTNMVQTQISRHALELQLNALQLAPLEAQPELRDAHKFLWAEHGDSIANFYVGTPALHADITRKGKRTISGMLTDGKNSLFRYYLNHHDDPMKQDALHLLLAGSYPPSQTPPDAMSYIGKIMQLFRPTTPPTNIIGVLYAISWAMCWFFGIFRMLKSIGSPFAPKAVLPASRVQPYSDKQRIRWKD